MRLTMLLTIALILTIALVIFPDIADQSLRLEAFGWVFESRQGAFTAALLLLLFVLWLLRSIIQMVFSGPSAIWQSLRSGSHKRKEENLRKTLVQWVDARSDNTPKALKKSRGILPDWLIEMLMVATTPAHAQKLRALDKQDPLLIALAARMATDPGATQKLDLATQKMHLEAWLKAHPDAPLALARLATVAEEEKAWHRVIELLEQQLQQGKSSNTTRSRLAHAYLQLASTEPEQAMDHLRKAYRLLPEEHDILLAYGEALQQHGDQATAQHLWLAYLNQHDAPRIAHALLSLLRPNAIKTYRKMEKLSETKMNHAQRWLRAELAHAAKLDGLAFEQMQALATTENIADAWRSLGAWHQAAGAYEKAADCYSRALKPPHPIKK